MSPTTRSVARTSTTCRHQPAIGEAVSIARLPSCGGQQSGRKGQAGPGGRSGGRRVAVSIALPSRMRASRPAGKWGEREGEGGHGCHGLTPPSRSVRGVAVSIVWCPSNPAGQGGQERERGRRWSHLSVPQRADVAGADQVLELGQQLRRAPLLRDDVIACETSR